MRPESRDSAYLWDMLEAARGIVEMTEGVDLHAFEADRMRRLAVERQFTILGEAARRVGDPFRVAHPEIPWGRVIGLRNLVMHEYDRIDVGTIWQIATENIPGLLGVLAGLVPPPPEDHVP
jgi:uncharacterized protein with HEPN domain